MRVFLAAISLCLFATMAQASLPPVAQIQCDDRGCWPNVTTQTRVQRFQRRSLSLDGMPFQLAAKTEEIVSACGSKIISAYRPGARVRGTGRLSLHATHKAVDIQGNPQCIYARLQGWAGGYSVDYGRVRHVHVSLDLENGREVGARFAHYRGHRHVRLARR